MSGDNIPALAVIVARGGSKRIPRKNIRSFHGQPIIAYTIRAAIESGCFSEVMVSTDDAEIARVAVEHAAVVPFFRSTETASDTATTSDALIEVIDRYTAGGRDFPIACCLYPTAPFMTASSIRRGRDLLLSDASLDSVMPVVQYSHPIERAFRIHDGRIVAVTPAFLAKRTQDLEPSYHDTGQFYWIRVDAFRRTSQVISPRTAAIVLPSSDVQDIDTEDDWALAEFKFAAMRGRA
jgi:pseudaminic acid cytidylyltransferase